MRTLLASSLAGAALLVAPLARAEPASWLSFGVGWAGERDAQFSRLDTALTFDGQAGLGTSLANPWVIGAVAGLRGNVSIGVDLSLAVRVATQGLMLGQWGVGADLGVVWRTYAPEVYGHFPIEPGLLLGIPWGPVLEVGVDVGDVSGQKPAALGGFATLSLDFVRLAAARAHAPASFFPDPPPPTDVTIEHVQ